MKSRVFATDKSIEKATKAAVKHEVQRVLPQIYADIEQNTSYQVMAVIMCVLEKHFGFGGKHLKEKYAIDFSQSQYKDSRKS